MTRRARTGLLARDAMALPGRLYRNARLFGERLVWLRGQGPRLAYVGGHGDRNLGDDALFEAAQRLLPEAQLVTFHAAPVERRLSRARLSGRGYFSAFILGGGTFINPYGLETTREALRQGLPAITLGTGVGSAGFNMRRASPLDDWAPLLRDFRAVGVRGPRSQAALEALGLRAEVVGDLALVHAREAITPPTTPRRFLVNITLPPPQEKEGFDLARLSGLERAITTLAARGFEPVFVAMHRNDFDGMRRLMAAVSRDGDTLHHPATAEELFALAAGCTLTLAVRLHAAVLSCCAGVPPLMLGYRDKCLDFMSSLGLEAWHLDLVDSRDDICERALALADAADSLRAPILSRAQAFAAQLRAYVARALPSAPRADNA